MKITALVVLFLTLFVTPILIRASSITSLNISGGASQNSDITVKVTLSATGKENNTNVRLQIIAPDGTVVASKTLDPPSLDDGDSWQGQWTTNNNNFPTEGNYTVTACWSPGNSSNCNIGSASSTFYSADTLGGLLLVLVVFLVALYLRQERKISRQTLPLC